VTLDQILAEGKTVTGLMSWCVFPDGRMGLPYLPDPLLECPLLDPLLESYSLSQSESNIFCYHFDSIFTDSFQLLNLYSVECNM